MEKITPDNVGCLMERFYSFFDASIKRIDIAYPSFGRTSAIVVMGARDQQSVIGNTILIHVEDIKEIVFREVNTSLQRMTRGLHIKWLEGSVWLAFQPRSTDLATTVDFAESFFYIAGHECFWEVISIENAEHFVRPVQNH
jgi:hypothetical protein